MSATGRSYTRNVFKVQYIIIQAILGRKSKKKNVQLPMKKYSVSVRPLTIKNFSHTDLRTFQAQFSENGCQYREEGSEDRILS